MFERQQIKKIIERVNEPSRFMQVLKGHRQVGKRTLIKQVLEKISMPYLFYSADAEMVTNGVWISICWSNVRRK